MKKSCLLDAVYVVLFAWAERRLFLRYRPAMVAVSQKEAACV